MSGYDFDDQTIQRADGVDSDNDGDDDLVQLDRDKDGVLDALVRDTDNDGRMDRYDPIRDTKTTPELGPNAGYHSV